MNGYIHDNHVLANALIRLMRCHECDPLQDLESMRSILHEPEVQEAAGRRLSRDEVEGLRVGRVFRVGDRVEVQDTPVTREWKTVGRRGVVVDVLVPTGEPHYGVRFDGDVGQYSLYSEDSLGHATPGPLPAPTERGGKE